MSSSIEASFRPGTGLSSRGIERAFVLKMSSCCCILGKSAGSGMRTVESCVTRSAESSLLLASVTLVRRRALFSSKTAVLRSSRAVNFTWPWP